MREILDKGGLSAVDLWGIPSRRQGSHYQQSVNKKPFIFQPGKSEPSAFPALNTKEASRQQKLGGKHWKKILGAWPKKSPSYFALYWSRRGTAVVLHAWKSPASRSQKWTAPPSPRLVYNLCIFMQESNIFCIFMQELCKNYCNTRLRCAGENLWNALYYRAFSSFGRAF